jgi:hypothetical protein
VFKVTKIQIDNQGNPEDLRPDHLWALKFKNGEESYPFHEQILQVRPKTFAEMRRAEPERFTGEYANTQKTLKLSVFE